jgi:hypothetical protein
LDSNPGHRGIDFHVLVGRHHTHASFGKMFLNKFHDERAAFPVEVGERFVHEPQRHVREQHARERDAALLAGRQRSQDQLLEPGDAEALVDFFRVAVRLGSEGAFEIEVLDERQVALQAGAVRQPDQRAMELLRPFPGSTCPQLRA